MAKKNEPKVFTLTVEKMTRTAVAQALVELKGRDGDENLPGTYVKLKLQMPPGKASRMPFASKWKMTLELVEDD